MIQIMVRLVISVLLNDLYSALGLAFHFFSGIFFTQFYIGLGFQSKSCVWPL